ncbi:O-antigen ligase family protein [Clostridium ganghwense]|uniref:O-antigen ligase family protein n=1 Tax=Clostridium ganghwense TaxID=312089 RepID=A0ABT4CRX5_9CLOT|nr:O-antigen ligase family protein [Clostridium ganghwense]MCY6371673.1 O-antigen ligase family protein [Clostridium ganghwense]
MVFLSIFLIVFSPYLAFLPMMVTGFQMLQKNNFTKNIWNIGLIFLFIWALFVGIINASVVSIAASFAVLVYFFISVYLENNYNEEEKIEKLLKNIILISIGSAFIGIIERFTLVHYNPTWWKYLFGIYPLLPFSETYRISGTFGNPNVAGTWYAAMVLICFYFYQKSFKIKKIFYALMVILFIGVLLMTGSRGAIIGLLVGLITYAYFMKDKKKMLFLIFILLSGIILMFAFPQYFPRGEGLLISIKDRSLIWKNCLNMFKYKPITGWGLMGIYFANGDVYDYVRTVHGHNIWITIITTLGIVGFSIFTCMIYYLFKETRVLSNHHCPLIPLLTGLEAVILGQGLVDFTIISPQAGIIFFGCSAIISGLAFQYKNVPVKDYFPMPLLSRIKNK